MRRIVSLILLSLMLLQAIPVLHFFSSQKAVFYAYVDEEKPEQKAEYGKDFNKVTASPVHFFEVKSQTTFSLFVEKHHSSPLLEFLTPPPDVC